MNNSRIELKFATGDHTRGLIESWISCHPAHFRQAYPDRWVNSLYFDNSDLDSLRDNYAGISRRVKARYRWYGELETSSRGNFELKFRENEAGWKNIFSVDGINFTHGNRLPEVISEIKQRINPEAISWMNRFHWPIVIIRYFRRYFVSADGQIRITFDQNLSCYSQQLSSRINLRRQALGLDPVSNIIEVKFSPDIIADAGHLVKGIPARRSRFSKYAWAAIQP